MIFIPSPNVAEDHQTKNAMALVNKGAAALLPDAEAEAKFFDEVSALVADDDKKKGFRRQYFSARCEKFSRSDCKGDCANGQVKFE